jgi:hypothetical protein
MKRGAYMTGSYTYVAFLSPNAWGGNAFTRREVQDAINEGDTTPLAIWRFYRLGLICLGPSECCSALAVALGNRVWLAHNTAE